MCWWLWGVFVWTMATIGCYKLAYRVVFAARVPFRAVADPATILSVGQAVLALFTDRFLTLETSPLLLFALMGLRPIADFVVIWAMVPTPDGRRMSCLRAVGMTAVVEVIFLIATVSLALLFWVLFVHRW